MVSQLNFIFTHEVLLLLQISILVSSWVPPASLSSPFAPPSIETPVVIYFEPARASQFFGGGSTASDLAGECCFLGLGIAHPFLVSWRAVDAVFAVFITAKDLREPAEKDVAGRAASAALARMCSHGTLLEKFYPVELAMDPFVPDVPGDLLLLAHSVEFAFRDLRSVLIVKRC